MAIRNDLLGGNDWEEKNLLTTQDLNDTFNAAVNKVRTLTAFWLNPELYDVWEDFSSYSPTDTISDATKFETTTSGAGTRTFTAQNSASAGGATPEARMRFQGGTDGGNSTYVLKVINLSPNKHKHIKLRFNMDLSPVVSRNLQAQVSFDKGSNWDNIVSNGNTPGVTLISGNTQILVIAQGNDNYDCYIGARRFRQMSDASMEIWFRLFNSGTNSSSNIMDLFIDDIVESRGVVN